MKRKTNLSVQNNRGARVIPNMHVGEEYHGYIPGDILDANMIVKLIHDAIAGISIEGTDLPVAIGSEQIIDKSVQLNDLSDEVTAKLGSTYVADSESLYLNQHNIN